MPEVKTALVLGVHSFADAHRRTGIQYVARELARRGVAVDYVSVPSSPLDVIGADRRARLARVWSKMGCGPVAMPVPNLAEFAFPAPLPAHAGTVRAAWMLKAVRFPAARHFASRRYDLCVHDVTPAMVYLPLVRADRFLLRLNDAPGGLPGLPGALVREMEARLRAGAYGHVWAVSEPLAAYARSVAPDTPATRVPNGVDAARFSGGVAGAGARRAVYAGGRVPWLDVDLVRVAARLLPDWEFHFAGDGFGGLRDAGNLRFLPPVAHEAVPSLLAGYAVGLLPYRDDPRMDCVERPLKFYEYVAAGLGVACSDVGGLRRGVGEWGRFGRTPEAFADAVRRAARAARAVSDGDRAAFVAENDWAARLNEMFAVVEGLGQRAPAAR